jgi:hypothetical protein
MSFSVSCSGKAKDVEAHLERKGEEAKPGRTGFEQKMIDLGVAFGVAAVKHASADVDMATGAHKTAGISISGHIGEDGCGSVSISLGIGAVAGGDDTARARTNRQDAKGNPAPLDGPTDSEGAE